MKYFESCLDASIHISLEDLSTLNGAENLIRSGEKIGQIGGVFHLQMILIDGLFENQTIENFKKVCDTKSTSFINLDSVCRKRCPNVEYFVAYSSGVSSRGNAGQTNYGFSNSVIDRVCEQRRADGLHGLSIHWGVIGDVGYVADNIGSIEDNIEIVGTIPQRMPSCLRTLDQLLQSDSASIITSFVRSETQISKKGLKSDLMKRVAHILGLEDYKRIDLNTKLVKLGMDSLMAVEIKQTIERDFDVVLSAKYVRDLTIAMIQEISSGNKIEVKTTKM